MEALLNHCEDYEDAEELQSAMSLVRKVRKDIAAKRKEEALQASELAAQQEQTAEEIAERAEEVANGLHIGKRKRDDYMEDQEMTKRQRNEAAEPSIEKSLPEDEIKRDREHASILVQNMPLGVTETKIRQYFSSCGVVKQVKLLQDEESSVIVEFEDANAANFALSRDGREFEGAELSIILNTGSTLFVTNYPATADDGHIRNIFQSYGEIVNVRFPSLLRNKKRRFCYVEFKQPGDAQKATELDGKETDGLPLSVKISNPGSKQTRTETNTDGRKVFVGQISFKARLDQVEKRFSQYGTIEHVKFPKDEKMASRNRGIAFLTFATSEEAQAALVMDGEEFMGRKLTVNLTSDRDNRSSRGMNGRSKSPSSQPDSMGARSRTLNGEDLADRRERTVVIGDVPDTVNQSRIRAAAEKVGSVRKVILKTSHQGAMIEFETVADAGRAMIELENLEIDPGRHIRVTTEKEMLLQKPEVKIEQFAQRPAATTSSAGGVPIRRPAQPGARKKGHLGMRSSALFGATDKSEMKDDESGEGSATKKSNDDFRNMINKS